MELENARDRESAGEGLRDESTIRRTTEEGVVDTGALMLMLPENVASRRERAAERPEHGVGLDLRLLW